MPIKIEQLVVGICRPGGARDPRINVPLGLQKIITEALTASVETLTNNVNILMQSKWAGIILSRAIMILLM